MRKLAMFLLFQAVALGIYAQDYKELQATTGVPEKTIVLLAERTGMKATQLVMRNSFTANETRINGVMSEARSEKSWEIVNELSVALRKEGLLIFVFEENFNFAGQPNKIAIIKGNDQFEILRIMKTHASSLGIDNSMVVAKLKQWDSEFGLVITGAGVDWLQANFAKQPEQMRTFAKEAYKFCQDIVEQGTGTIDALGEEMARTNVLYLWWD
jgi:Domain of unknown function (DUF4253)